MFQPTKIRLIFRIAKLFGRKMMRAQKFTKVYRHQTGRLEPVNGAFGAAKQVVWRRQTDGLEPPNLLVLGAQQIVDGLHGVERAEGHLNEDGVPVGHGTVPKSGQLERLELLAVLRL